MKAIKKLLKTINNNSSNSKANNNNNNTKVVRSSRVRKRNRKRQAKRNIIIKNNPIRQAAYTGIPMAVPVNYRKYFSMKNLGETAVKISGCDLIYKIPDNLSVQQSNIITLIPANPAYWTGTRIAALAQGYQNYRPVRLTIHYCPQCPVTQQGNVIGGTLWDDVPSVDSMQQSLKTSNGGFLTQCYQPMSTNIRLKSNLQINLYRMAGDLNQQSNPFYFIAMAIATYNQQQQLINPGIFYVEYTYVLKNPIGSSTQYKNTGITTTTQTTQYYTNAIAITCANLQINEAQFPPGTRLNVEKSDSTYKYYYNDTEIPPPSIPIWVLMNQPISMTSVSKSKYETVVYYQATFEPQGNINVTPKHAYLYKEEVNDYYELVMNTGPTQIDIGPVNASIVYVINLLDDTINGLIEYENTSENYTLTYYKLDYETTSILPQQGN